MQKTINELTKLDDINEACGYATKLLEKTGKSYSSILAISDLVTPTLKSAISEHYDYFKMTGEELRRLVDNRETMIYNAMCVLHELGELAMNIDQDTASIGSVIEDINGIATGVNAGIKQVVMNGNGVSDDNNPVFDTNNPVSNTENSKGATDHE